MPLHVLPNRRQFLASSLAAGAAIALPRFALGAGDSSKLATFALLADTHVAADKAAVLREVKMAENLAKVWAEVRDAKPAAALVHGDVAVLKGELGDYRTVADLMLPAGKTDLPIHYLLGNHDNRDSFREVLRDHGASPLDSHVVAVLEAGPVNWFLLDSLDKVNSTPGRVGEAQLAWLTASLDARADKPAIVSVHHNLVFPMAPDTKISGLTDTAALFEALQPRKQVKAIVYGHTHNWSLGQREGIHLINLPPVAYVFAQGRPNGWVSADVLNDGMTLTLHALDRAHAQHGEKHELAWR